jgi:hypothetical protein
MFNHFDQFFTKTDTEAVDAVDSWRDMKYGYSLYKDASATSARPVNFLAQIAVAGRKDDPRVKAVNQKRFFESSAVKLAQVVDQHPSLCAGIISPICCRAGSPARAWTLANQAAVKVPCEGRGAKRGMLHTWITSAMWGDRANFPAKFSGKYEAFTNVSMASGILGSDAATAGGGLWDGEDSGFVRVEDLFAALRAVFTASGRVDMATGVFVSSLTRLAHGRLQVECGAGSDAASAARACGKGYVKVIVAAGAGSVPLLDPTFSASESASSILQSATRGLSSEINTQTIPVKGYAIATDVRHVPDDQLGVGVQVQEHNHFIRPQSNGGIRYGFGYVVDKHHFKDEGRAAGPAGGRQPLGAGRRCAQHRARPQDAGQHRHSEAGGHAAAVLPRELPTSQNVPGALEEPGAELGLRLARVCAHLAVCRAGGRAGDHGPPTAGVGVGERAGQPVHSVLHRSGVGQRG